ncbi:MAG: iron dependent repressor, metal binding and dimerization domain protein [Chloroflexota bacterium]
MPDPLAALAIGLALVGLSLLLFWPDGGLVAQWGRVRRISTRVRREDALKHLCTAELEGYCPTLQSVAGALHMRADDAAALLADLERRELVTSQGDRLCLTPAGRALALHVIRAHRLWERHLAEDTGFAEVEWHARAERHEHQLSPGEADALDARLGHPVHDPHGDPIPTSDGAHAAPRGQRLTAMPLSQPLRVVHVEDEPEAVYAQLIAQGVHPGLELRLIEVTPQRVRFWAGGDEHVLAPIVAANVSVVPLPREALETASVGERLSALAPGEQGTVVSISPGCRAPERWRLMDLGIVPGTAIAAELVSPGGDPVAYRIRDTLIALRREQSDLIRVRITRGPGVTP